MSDLEPSSSRAQSAAPITQLATGRLRALSASSSPFAESDGLIDAFAEVFARMAIAAPPPVQTNEAPTDEAHHEVAVDDSAEPTAAESTSQNDHDSSNSREKVDADPILILDESAEQTTLTDNVEVTLDSAESQVDTPSIDENIADQVDQLQQVIKPQSEAEQVETVEQVDDSPEIIAPVTTVNSEEGKGRRDRRDSQQVQANRGAEVTNVRSPSDNRSDSTAPRDVDLDQQVGEVSSESEGWSDENPRGRSRRHGRGEKSHTVNEGQLQRVSEQTRPAREGEVARARTEATEWAAEVTRAQDTATPHVRRTPNGVNNAATAIAAQTASSGNATNNAVSNVRGVTSQATQPIDPATSTSKTQPRAKTGGKDPQSQTSDLVSRAKLIQRVSKAFQHLGPEGGQVRIRLSPPELGTVRVEMRIQQRRIQARVVAESEAASNALREHLPDLRSRLESQGMQIDKIEVETETSDNVGSQLGDTHDHENTRQEQSFGRRPRHSDHQVVSQNVSQLTASSMPEHVNRSAVGVDVRL